MIMNMTMRIMMVMNMMDNMDLSIPTTLAMVGSMVEGKKVFISGNTTSKSKTGPFERVFARLVLVPTIM